MLSLLLRITLLLFSGAPLVNGENAALFSLGRRSIRNLQQQPDRDKRLPDYYDALRLRSDLTVESEPDSKIYRVTLNSRNETYRLADIKTFLPYSENKRLRQGGWNDGFAALLAMWHFNNPEISPLPQPDQQVCNVKLTMELFDTELSPIETTKTMTSVLKRPVSVQSPPVAAVVGASRSAVTSPLAIVTGIHDIFQVSWSSTSLSLESSEQYPLFGRTVTSTIGEAKAALRFFQSIGSTHVAIIYATDTFGSSLQESFQNEAETAGLRTKSIGFKYGIDLEGPEVRTVMESLKRTQFRHVYAIFFDAHFASLMGAANDLGLVGPEYLYVFPGFDVFKLQQDFSVEADSPLVDAYKGAAFVQMQGSVSSEVVIPGEESVSQPVREASSRSERLCTSWIEALENPDFVQFVRSKYPISLSELEGFGPEAEFAVCPGGFAPFLYDAVLAVGLSMCRAGQSKPFFTGGDVHEQFKLLDFEGSSGTVRITSTGTRDYETVSFVIWNTQLIDPNVNGFARFKFVPTCSLKNDRLDRLAENTFIYADGTERPPKSLPLVNYDFNYIGNAARTTGYVLMGLAMFSALLSLLWLIYFRQERVITSSQPLFLVMVSCGAIIMASTIIPLSMEEPVLDNEKGLDRACMASPWLLVMGNAVALSGLLAKSYGVYEAYTNPDLEFIHVTRVDILKTLAILLALNTVVLLTWSLVSPLHWTRTFQDVTDIFDRQVESQGGCESEHALAYVIVLAVINMVPLCVGNWFAYQARNIETEFNDGHFVSLCLGAVLQSWFLGIPILIVVWDNVQARYYVQSAIIFVLSMAYILPSYIPKMIALRKNRSHQKKQAYAAFRMRSSDWDADGSRGSDESPDANDRDLKETGGEENSVESETAPEHESGELGQEEPKGLDDVLNGEEVPGDTSVKPNSFKMRQSLNPDLSTADNEPNTKRTGLKLKQSWTLDSTNAGKKDTSPRRSSLRRGSSDSVPGNAGGVKVLHNPRSKSNLELTGGRELSRAQLHFFKESSSGLDGSLPHRGGGNPDRIEEVVEEDDVIEEETDQELQTNSGSQMEDVTEDETEKELQKDHDSS